MQSVVMTINTSQERLSLMPGKMETHQDVSGLRLKTHYTQNQQLLCTVVTQALGKHLTPCMFQLTCEAVLTGLSATPSFS